MDSIQIFNMKIHASIVVHAFCGLHMTNIQNIRLTKILSYLPDSNLSD